MKQRALTVALCLLYLSVAVVFGAVHHHEAGHNDCPACTWQIGGTTDTPVVSTTPIDISVAVTILPACEPVIPVAPFLPSTASRAPPVASA